jgi:arylsulfatase
MYTRRDFLKASGIGAVSIFFSGCTNILKSSKSNNSSTRPNIILIMADDMGYSDIGCFGGEIDTPNIDSLADNGIRFTQFYNTARCCPTRASLLTGLYAHQAGIGHMTVENTEATEDEEAQYFDYGYLGYRGSLNRNCVTIAEVLKSAGYHTLMSGKWHVGTFEEMWPLERGFDQYFGIILGACNYWKPAPDKLLVHNRKPINPWDGFYTTDVFTDYAIKFISVSSKANDNPFFCYLAYNAPHWPLHAWPEDIAKYRGKYRKGWNAIRKERYERMVRMGLIKDEWKLSEQDAPAWEDIQEEKKDELDFRMAIYAAMIDRMDQNIGRLIEKLRDLGELDNTLILFFVDNGACAEDNEEGYEDVYGAGPVEQLGTKKGYFLTYGRAWANASNTPYRLYKHWSHEGGIASPLIAHWPNRIKDRGALRNELTHLIDLMPTCLEVAEAEYPNNYKGNTIPPMEGVSFVPVFDNKSLNREAIYFEHEGNRAVRMGRWKLVAEHKEPWRLYNMEVDRTETSDLSKEYPDMRSKMIEMYNTWAKRCGVLPWPVRRKKDFEPPERIYPKTWKDIGM